MLTQTNYTLTQLEYVMAVHRFGHFAKAAKACAISQPTLSMQIQKLENALGVTIFDRSKKPILLTDSGKKVIDQIQSLLFEAKKLDNLFINAKSTTLEGSLHLGIIPTIAPYLLPLLLPEIESSFPGMRLKVEELQTEQIINALNQDEIDAAILATPLKLPQIHENALFYEPFSIVCQKGHSLSKLKSARYSNLSGEDLWLLEDGHCLRHQVLDICSIRKNQKGRRFEFESGSIETLKNLVNAYGGYTLVPALAQSALGNNSIIVPFERPIPAREVGIVFRRAQYKSELLEALSEAILACIPNSIRALRRKDLEVLSIR
jgi:LysR family hydrogen peroxide-inducible transcriptional activator